MATRQSTGDRTVQTAQAGSPSTTFKPVRDSVSHEDMVVNNPAPNASVPAVPTGRVVKS